MGKVPLELAVEYWPVASLRPSPKNPRTHPKAQLDDIVSSIEAFGFVNPILIAPDGEIIAGEARWLAIKQTRQAEVPVIVLGHLNDVERLAYRLADNRIPLGASWNDELLGEVMAEIAAVDFDLEVIGFSDDEIAQLLDPTPVDEIEDVPPPPLPTNPVTREGDLWLLGEHRLICGDSTSVEVLSRLISGVPAKMVMADLVFTDPPYGMSFGKGKEAGSTTKGALVKAHGMILGDDAQGDDLIDLVRGALSCAHQHTRPGGAFYVCFTWRTYAEFEAAVNAAGLNVAACIVWDKGSIGLGHQHYRPQHEFIFYCKGDRWYGGKAEGDVWNFTRGNTGEYVHPTQKPLTLVVMALRNSSLPGDVVLDVFGGSGSTLIAAEQLQRRARLVELDPKYVDAIIQRWEGISGGAATLAGTGRTFAEVKKERYGEGLHETGDDHTSG